SLGTVWTSFATLLEPSPARAKAYTALRRDNERRLRSLERALKSRDYKEARRLVALTRESRPTKAERDRVTTLVARMPESERPLLLPEARYDTRRPPGGY